VDDGGTADAFALTVLIPTFEGGDVIAQQLEALAGQEFTGSWEVIVADNASGDDTVTVVKTFTDRLPGLHLVDASAQSGKAYALNEGARAARGRSIVFLDQDDVVQPGYLAAMAAALEQSSFVAARMEYESLNPTWLSWSRRPAQTEGVGLYLEFLPAAAGCSLGIRRAVLQDVGGFDDTIVVSDDIDLCWRVQLAGHELDFVPDAVLSYRYRDSVRGIFAQALGYGAAVPLLYRRYRARGMPRRSWPEAVRFYAGALTRLVRLAWAHSESDLAGCAHLIGYRIGLIKGCVKNRVFYL
jgi:GT2 family glycosyltransferase